MCILRENSHKLIVNLTLEIQKIYTVMHWIFVINPENMKVFAWLLMHAIRLFISILSDFVTSHKITFYSKLYDIDLLENFTHDRTYITLYVHEFLSSLHQHCFFWQKSPTYYLNYHFTLVFWLLTMWKFCCSAEWRSLLLLLFQYCFKAWYSCKKSWNRLHK